MKDIQSFCIENIKNKIYDAVLKFADETKAIADIKSDDISVEIPADSKNGDFACSYPLSAAKIFRLPPFEIANNIVSLMGSDIPYIKNIQVAKPGFINFFVSEEYFSKVLSDIMTQKDNYGHTNYGQGKKVLRLSSQAAEESGG